MINELRPAPSSLPSSGHDLRGRVAGALDAGIGHRRLLTHSFYRRWEAGELAPAELAAYAEQYRHVEAALPSVLTEIVDHLPDGAARDLVCATLDDEAGTPAPHAQLFEGFATAAGARSAAEAGPAARRLVAAQRGATARPIAALSMLAAYEVQAAAVARSKGDGLRRHYGFDADGTRFWDVHAELEADHATWSADALGSLADAPGALACIREFAALGALAWWDFLDERESAAAAA